MNNELSNVNNDLSADVIEAELSEQKVYSIANVWRVFFARLFDIFVSAIPGIILASPLVGLEYNSWVNAIVHLAIGLGFIIIYFMIIPIFLKGNTIGKYIFRIRSIRNLGDKKIKWWMVVARESYFLLIPWIVSLACLLIALAIMQASKPENADEVVGKNYGAYIVYQLGYVFYFLWFVFLAISIKVQDQHQSGIDIKFGIYTVYKDPIKEKKKVIIEEKLTRDKHHVSLTDMPGNFTNENLKELENSEEKEFSKSISLDDLDIKPNENILENNTKIDEIEYKDDEEDGE